MLSRSALLRLGLFQMAAGGLSVIFLGVLNRIMRVELGLDLFAVSLLVGGGHYLGALVAIPFGFFSDSHSIAGYRRTFYVLLGALVTASILAVAPWVVQWLSVSTSPVKFFLGFLFFLLEGISTYVAGTAFLALIADQTLPKERGRATAVVWTMLFLGIIATGIGTGIVLDEYSFDRMVTLFLIGSAVAVSLSLIALVGQEKRRQQAREKPIGRLADALRMVLQSRNSRYFGIFLLLSMFSFFMQDVILEPFGGEVLGLTLGATTRFNAFMGVGLIASMLMGGIYIIPRKGKRWVTELGCWILIAAFLALASTAFMESGGAIVIIVTMIGLGGGLFTVGGVALMMDMTLSEHTGLFVGAWTLIQALARGPASLASGGLFNIFSNLGASAAQGYGSVFLVEAIGLGISLIFLRQVAVTDFQMEAYAFITHASEAMD